MTRHTYNPFSDLRRHRLEADFISEQSADLVTTHAGEQNWSFTLETRHTYNSHTYTGRHAL